MDDFLKEAVAIAKAQASVRVLSEDELSSMIDKLYRALQALSGDERVQAKALDISPKDAIRDGSITCLVCGRAMRLLTARHLKSHGLTPGQYRAQFGYKESTPLVCKKLQKTRKANMKEIRLWERKKPA